MNGTSERFTTGRSRSRKASSAAAAGDPLEFFEREHIRHREMCNALEAIADGLPDLIDPPLCASVAGMLRDDLPAHHRSEEEVLFPLLLLRAEPGDSIGGMLTQLRHEHAIDEAYAGEIGELLDGLSRGDVPENPDMIGYMLRGFFESYRRHVHWEQAVVLPLARRRFTDDDLRRLAEELGGQRK